MSTFQDKEDYTKYMDKKYGSCSDISSSEEEEEDISK